MSLQERNQELAALQKTLGYTFSDLKLLNKSLTHKSYVNEKTEALKHNERFEFLGDSVLDLIMSDYMVSEYEDFREGMLSKIRASVVNESCLAELARRIDLGRYLLLGKGELLSGGREKVSLLANAFEAMAGAVYRDSNLEKASAIFLPLLQPEINKFIENRSSRDYKSELQEYTQNKLLCIPTYKVTRERGPDHEKEFEIVVMVKEQVKGNGTGRSKKEAEQSAAKMALEHYLQSA